MRVLLDENVDHRLMQLIESDHEVLTVRGRGWGGKKNGELLRLAEAEFDVLVTLDSNMRHQQNLPSFDLAVILITGPSNKRSAIAPAMDEVNRLLPEVMAGHIYIVSA